MTDVYAILLAGGHGSRFGGDKLLALLEGKPLIAHVAAKLSAAMAGRVLTGGLGVIPTGTKALQPSLEAAGLTPVENPHSAAGLSTSLALGLAALNDIDPRAGGALIVLADQPALRSEVIQAVVAEWRRTGKTTRPRYAGAPGEPGHPVLLDRHDWPLAARLTGDQGLRHLLAGVEVTVVDVPGNNPDVDTPDDLRRLEEYR